MGRPQCAVFWAVCARVYSLALRGVAGSTPWAGGHVAGCEPRVGMLSGAAPGPTVSGPFRARLLPCSLAGCF